MKIHDARPPAAVEKPEVNAISDQANEGDLEEKGRLTACSGINLRTLVLAVVVACIMSLLGGTTLSYSSSTLLELQELPDIRFRFEDTILSDLFGVRRIHVAIFFIVWYSLG